MGVGSGSAKGSSLGDGVGPVPGSAVGRVVVLGVAVGVALAARAAVGGAPAELETAGDGSPGRPPEGGTAGVGDWPGRPPVATSSPRSTYARRSSATRCWRAAGRVIFRRVAISSMDIPVLDFKRSLSNSC